MLGLSNFRYQELPLSGFAIGSVVLVNTPTHHTGCEVHGVRAQTSASTLSQDMLHVGRGTFWLRKLFTVTYRLCELVY